MIDSNNHNGIGLTNKLQKETANLLADCDEKRKGVQLTTTTDRPALIVMLGIFPLIRVIKYVPLAVPLPIL
jgi:hypothetical protein